MGDLYVMRNHWFTVTKIALHTDRSEGLGKPAEDASLIARNLLQSRFSYFLKIGMLYDLVSPSRCEQRARHDASSIEERNPLYSGLTCRTMSAIISK